MWDSPSQSQPLALLLLPESPLCAHPAAVLGGSDVSPALLALPASGALEGLTQYLQNKCPEPL